MTKGFFMKDCFGSGSKDHFMKDCPHTIKSGEGEKAKHRPKGITPLYLIVGN